MRHGTKRLGRRAIIGVFGDSSIWVPFSQADSCMSIKHQIDAVAQKEERSGLLASKQLINDDGLVSHLGFNAVTNNSRQVELRLLPKIQNQTK